MNFSKLFFWIAAVISIPLYAWQKMTNISPESGFFLEQGVAVWIFYAVLVLALCGMVGYAMWIMQDCNFSISNSKILAVLSFGLAGTILWGGVRALLRVISGGEAGESASFFSLFLSIGSFVVALLSCIVFVRLGYGYFKEDIANRGSYTFIFPILWGLMSSLQLFQSYPQIAGMPDRVLFLLCLLAFTLFLVGQGRILSDVNMARGVRFVCGCGFAAALCGFVLLAGDAAARIQGAGLPLGEVLLTAFISLYCFSFSLGTTPLRRI